jgi:dTDP-4-amino-4,6-dideoxygalactose transaminase
MGHHPLSGFLGGMMRGGHYVQRFEELWSRMFHVKHSILVNSATSGLLAACEAAGVRPGTIVETTPFTMSATAAAARFLGADIWFGDIEEDTFCLDRLSWNRNIKATIVTNLFGHPARLRTMREEADQMGRILIEDNAQAPMAMEDGKYTGTIGHIGVFSLNIHKHIQCGEGGVICTQDDGLAKEMRGFINHGELSGGKVGLNLRATEITAAIGISQLARSTELIGKRVDQAEKLIAKIAKIAKTNWLTPPVVRDGCTHVYYMVPFRYVRSEGMPHRNVVVDALVAEGVPLVKGYVTPLNRMKQFVNEIPPEDVSSRMHYDEMICFSNCEWSPTDTQIDLIGEAFAKVSNAFGL